MDKKCYIVLTLISGLVYVKAQPGPFRLHVISIDDHRSGVVEDRGYMSEDFDEDYMLDLNYGRGWQDHTYRRERLPNRRRRRRRGVRLRDEEDLLGASRGQAPAEDARTRVDGLLRTLGKGMVYKSKNVIIKKVADGSGGSSMRGIMKDSENKAVRKGTFDAEPHYIVYQSATKSLDLGNYTQYSKPEITTSKSIENNISTTISSDPYRGDMTINRTTSGVQTDTHDSSAISTNSVTRQVKGGKKRRIVAKTYKERLKKHGNNHKDNASVRFHGVKSAKNIKQPDKDKNGLFTESVISSGQTKTTTFIKKRSKRSIKDETLKKKRSRREFSAKEFAKRARAFGRTARGGYADEDDEYDSPGRRKQRRRFRNKPRDDKSRREESSEPWDYRRKREYERLAEASLSKEHGKATDVGEKDQRRGPEKRKYVGPLLRERFRNRQERRKHGGPPEPDRYPDPSDKDTYGSPRRADGYGRSYRPGPGRYDYDGDKGESDPPSEMDRYEFEPDDGPRGHPRPPHPREDQGPNRRRYRNRDYGREPERGRPRRRDYPDSDPEDYDYSYGPPPPHRPSPYPPPRERGSHRGDMHDSMDKQFFQDRGFKGFGSFYKYGDEAPRPFRRKYERPSLSYRDEEDTYPTPDYDLPEPPPPPPPPLPPPPRRHRKYHEPEPPDYDVPNHRDSRHHDRRPPEPEPRSRSHHDYRHYDHPNARRPYRPRRRSGYRGPGPTYRVVDDGQEELMRPYAREADLFKEFDLDDMWSKSSFSKSLMDEDEDSFFSSPLFSDDSETKKKTKEGPSDTTTPEPNLADGDDARGSTSTRQAQRGRHVQRRFRRTEQSLPHDLQGPHGADDYTRESPDYHHEKLELAHKADDYPQDTPTSSLESVDYPREGKNGLSYESDNFLSETMDFPRESVDYLHDKPEIPDESPDYRHEITESSYGLVAYQHGGMDIPPDSVEYPFEDIGLSSPDMRGLPNDPEGLRSDPIILPEERMDYPRDPMMDLPEDLPGLGRYDGRPPPTTLAPPGDDELAEESGGKVVAAPRTFDKTKGRCGEVTRLDGFCIKRHPTLYGHPVRDCFIQCDANGNTYMQMCPPGLVWTGDGGPADYNMCG